MTSSTGAVTSPLRLLILTPAPPNTAASQTSSSIPPLLTALTGSTPSSEQVLAGFAGYTSHAPLQLRTKYYDASIGIWCDEVGQEWQETMADAATEAKEVRSAIGAIVFVLGVKVVSGKEDIAKALTVLEQVEEIRAMCEDEGDGREVVGAVILAGRGSEEKVDEVEEGLRAERSVFGWDVIAWDGNAEPVEGPDLKNDHGEKIGIERVKQILEAVPWTTTSTEAEEADFLDSDNEVDWTTSEQMELDREMMKLKMDLQDEEGNDKAEDQAFGEDEWPELQKGSEDIKVEQLQGLMERLIATREAASELSGAEKRKFAKREVERIMKELR